jgi:hypothetical protein
LKLYDARFCVETPDAGDIADFRLPIANFAKGSLKSFDNRQSAIGNRQLAIGNAGAVIFFELGQPSVQFQAGNPWASIGNRREAC